MIKSLHIQNFQSHSDTALEFHEGVNVIIGPSDCGKTAILRALNWVINNRPAGEEFRSRWGGDTIVNLKLDDCHSLVRGKRTKSPYANTYHMQPIDDKEAYLFEAFGQDVPQEISAALNMDEINLQRQHDAPFLLSESAAEVARRLNKVASLETIDKAHKGIASIIDTLRKEEKTEAARVTTLQDDLRGFAYLDEMEQDVLGLERLVSHAGRLRQQEADLGELLRAVDDCSKELEEAKSVLEGKTLLEEIEALLDARNALQSQSEALSDLLTDIETCNVRIVVAKEVLELSNLVAEIDKLVEERDKVVKEEEELSCLLLDVQNQTKLNKQNEQRLSKLQKEFSELMPDQCPLCGRSD